MTIFKKLVLKKLKITLFKEDNQNLDKIYSQTKILNFRNYDTIIIGSKNQKIINHLEKMKSKFKKKIIINIFGNSLSNTNKKVKIFNL